jgi:predicted RNA-binding protein YlqC (UPF0109 family)
MGRKGLTTTKHNPNQNQNQTGIRELSGAHITILQSGTDHRSLQFRLVAIAGPIPTVSLAVQLIGAQAGLFDDDPHAGAASMLHDPLFRFHNQPWADGAGGGAGASSPPADPGVRMVIEAGMVGQLLGRRGRRVQEVKSQTGVRRIQVLTAEESRQEGGVRSERVVLLLGKGDNCRRAHHLISTILAMDPQELQRREEGFNLQQQQEQQQQLEQQEPSILSSLPIRRETSASSSTVSAFAAPFALPPPQQQEQPAGPVPASFSHSLLGGLCLDGVANQEQQEEEGEGAEAPSTVAAGVMGHDRRGSTDRAISTDLMQPQQAPAQQQQAAPVSSPKAVAPLAKTSNAAAASAAIDAMVAAAAAGTSALGLGPLDFFNSASSFESSSSTDSQHLGFVGALSSMPLPPPGLGVPAAGTGTSSSGGSSVSSGGNTGGGDEMEFSSEVLIRISNDNIGRLIGKEGCIIRRIRHESKCCIEIDNCPPTRDFAMRTVRVRGHIAQTHVATAMVLRQMLGDGASAAGVEEVVM